MMKTKGIFNVKNRMRDYAEIVEDLHLRYFHGNVRAQLGRIITREDVEARRKRILKYAFWKRKRVAQII